MTQLDYVLKKTTIKIFLYHSWIGGDIKQWQNCSEIKVAKTEYNANLKDILSMALFLSCFVFLWPERVMQDQTSQVLF